LEHAQAKHSVIRNGGCCKTFISQREVEEECTELEAMEANTVTSV